MKILVCGDPHFRSEMPYASAISDGRQSEWEAVKQTILDKAKECDAVVLMGDNLNARNNPSIVLKEFVEFLNGFGQKPVHILIGNHERQGTVTALDFLDKINHQNWHVYSSIVQSVDLGGVRATFIPYMTPALLGVETKEDAEEVINNLAPADIAFFHHAITGTKGTEFFEEIMVDKNKLKFGFTFGGHVHKPERLANNVVVTGNLFTHEIGEHHKEAWVWDSSTNTATEVPLPVRGIYKIEWGKIPPNWNGVPQTYSIVKCYVTDREVNIEEVKKFLEPYDASLIVEQYPSERAKVHFESGGLDTSTESMLKLYSEARNVSHADLLAGFELIKQTI